MAHKADGDSTMFQIAQQLLGNGTLAHSLRMVGWDGKDPHFKPPKDSSIMVPGEKTGPPSHHLTDPSRWGRG